MPDESCELCLCFVCIRCCEECGCRSRSSNTPATDAYERKLKAAEKQRRATDQQNSTTRYKPIDADDTRDQPPRREQMARSTTNPLDTSDNVT